MTEEQQALLEAVAHALDGKLTYCVCCDKFTQHNKIVIEYNHQKKNV